MADVQPVVSVHGISKRYPGVRALGNVSLDVCPGEVHALVGENGAGKSTLMLILSGVEQADEGEIRIDGRRTAIPEACTAKALGIGTVFQELSLVSGLSIAENIFAHRLPARWGVVDRRELEAGATDALGRLGVHLDPSDLVRSHSIATRQLVEIAKALAESTKLLILDEPTSSLTLNETDRLLDMVRSLRSEGLAILFISHKMSEVFRIADRITVLREGKIVAAMRTEDTNPDEIVGLMAGRTIASASERKHVPGRREMLRLESVSSPPDFENVSLAVSSGEIVGLAGLKGAGRSELARAVFGLSRIKSGRVLVAGRPVRFTSPCEAVRAGIGYLPEDRKEEGLFLGLSVWENVAASALHTFTKQGVLDRSSAREAASAYRSSLSIRTPGVDQVVQKLSGGNQQKVLLAKWLLCDPKVFIVDEPTRGVDVGTRADIHNLLRALADRGTAVIVISSDMPEIVALSDRLYVMADGRIAGRLDGEEISEEAIMRLATQSRLVDKGVGA